MSQVNKSQTPPPSRVTFLEIARVFCVVETEFNAFWPCKGNTMGHCPGVVTPDNPNRRKPRCILTSTKLGCMQFGRNVIFNSSSFKQGLILTMRWIQETRALYPESLLWPLVWCLEQRSSVHWSYKLILKDNPGFSEFLLGPFWLPTAWLILIGRFLFNKLVFVSFLISFLEKKSFGS